MSRKSLTLASFLVAAALAASAGVASAQPAGPSRLTARAPDLVPIPSRIEHGVVSVRNAGTAASTPSIVTVECNVTGRRGGCPEIPGRYLRRYTNGAYPNKLVIHVPALPVGHVHNHNLAFWGAITPFPAGSYDFTFMADAGMTVGETNEGNNAGAHTWVVP
ncbi:MAG: hypothetical protein AB7J28_15930 [Hyphomonadaceae bacterium]